MAFVYKAERKSWLGEQSETVKNVNLGPGRYQLPIMAFKDPNRKSNEATNNTTARSRNSIAGEWKSIDADTAPASLKQPSLMGRRSVSQA